LNFVYVCPEAPRSIGPAAPLPGGHYWIAICRPNFLGEFVLHKGAVKKKKKKKNLIACRGLGRAVGPLLAARALPLCCAASTMRSSTLLAI
jgi:hypothetical protein